MKTENLKNKETLFIIGNGFDLFHNLKSSYNDFKEWMESPASVEYAKKWEQLHKKDKKSIFSEFNNHELTEYFCNNSNKLLKDLDSIEHNNLSDGLLSDAVKNSLISKLDGYNSTDPQKTDLRELLDIRHRKFITKLCEYNPALKKDDGTFTWSNLEEALGKLDVNDVNSRYSNMCKTMCKKYEQINNQSPTDESSTNESPTSAKNYTQSYLNYDFEFVQPFPLYLREWINTLNAKLAGSDNSSQIAQSEIIKQSITNNAFYFNFNYTDTLQNLYGINDENILYIHGRASKKENLSFGHNITEKEYGKLCTNLNAANPNDYNIYNDLSPLYFKPTFKNVDEKINNNPEFFNNLSNIKNVVILGCSLSQIDIKYFKIIKEYVSKDCSWYCSGTSEKSRKSRQERIATELFGAETPEEISEASKNIFAYKIEDLNEIFNPKQNQKQIPYNDLKALQTFNSKNIKTSQKVSLTNTLNNSSAFIPTSQN